MVAFSKIALGVAACLTTASAFVPSTPHALTRSSIASSPGALNKRVQAPSHSLVSLRCTAEESTPSRREFGRLLAGLVAAGAAPLPSFGKEDGKKAAGKVECRSSANRGAEMSMTVCSGGLEIEFKRAYETTGSKTKATGDEKRMDTFYSQINAGYLTLVDLKDQWDSYNAAGDGDVIRRRLGTVGRTSPLHNIRVLIRKPLRKVFEGAVRVAAASPAVDQEAFEELDELLNMTISGIAEVDTNLYSTAFVGTQETAQQLRDKGKEVLLRTLDQYKKFLAILTPVYEAETVALKEKKVRIL